MVVAGLFFKFDLKVSCFNSNLNIQSDERVTYIMTTVKTKQYADIKSNISKTVREIKDTLTRRFSYSALNSGLL